MRIIQPENAGSAYGIAAQACRDMWRAVTGQEPCIGTEWGDGDAIVIGADDVQPCTWELLSSGALDSLGLRYGTDDYSILSARRGEHDVLVLAGGRGRSTLYAVYDYFARAAGARYYWDGDVVPHRDTLPLAGFEVHESPRFDLRGLRYFAHRSLTRFQAEQWGYEDWKREIDWMCRRRLNFFMLRIGHDDIFQRAFPELVPYPDPNTPCPEYDPETMMGYDDRTLFWPLEYRGKLRKMVLDYAAARDLIHAEDCGTMTHWYSRTPHEFIRAVQPDFLPQATAGYNDPTGLVWDIRKQENLDRYFRLTEACTEHYGCPELFHTIGLAERMCCTERRDNLNLKLYTYRQIARRLRDRYPQSKLLIASWDLWMFWTPEEVQRLVSEFDPERTMILDYTSETAGESNCFKNWGLMNRFPWIFGIFHAYEPENDMRGDYARIGERLRLAAEDPMCRGMVLWPEMSHSDTLMLEYLAENAWAPEKRDVHELMADLCRGRYGSLAGYMNRVWEDFFPLIRLECWYQDRDNPAFNRFGMMFCSLLDQPWIALWGGEEQWVRASGEAMRFRLAQASTLDDRFSGVLRELGELTEEQLQDEHLRRDAIDIARAVVHRRIDLGLMRTELCIREAPAGTGTQDGLKERCDAIYRLTQLLGELLSTSPDFSLNASFRRLSREAPVNPCFEKTLKRNASAGYCRTMITELFGSIYLPAMRAYFDFIGEGGLRGRIFPDRADFQRQLTESFIETPLADMEYRSPRSVREILRELAESADAVRI